MSAIAGFSAFQSQMGNSLWQNELQSLYPKLYEPFSQTTFRRDATLVFSAKFHDKIVGFDYYDQSAGAQNNDDFPWHTPGGTDGHSIDVIAKRENYPYHTLRYDIAFNIDELSIMATEGAPQAKAMTGKKFSVLQRSFELDTDKLFYAGSKKKDWCGLGSQGPEIDRTNVAVSAVGSHTEIEKKSELEILKDFVEPMEALTDLNDIGDVDANGFKFIIPARKLLYIKTRPSSIMVNSTIYQYLTTGTGLNIEIVGAKHLKTLGEGGTNRMICIYKYEEDQNLFNIQIPTPTQTVTLSDASQNTPHFAKISPVQVTRPMMMIYRDGI